MIQRVKENAEEGIDEGISPGSPSSDRILSPDENAEPLPVELPRIWGLSTRQLHDGFWRSKGVQCVRRGEREKLQRHADLYLLLEPDQLVLFDLTQISDRLTWHNAQVTRVRLIDEGAERYFEHVVTDDCGLVRAIERRYRPRVASSSRIVITPSRRLAGYWMHARSRHDGWDRVRRAVPWSRVDHQKCVGRTFVEANPIQERELIDGLVERWPYPNQAILGLKEFDSGVWHAEGRTLKNGTVRVGPLWLGIGAENGHRPCLVGPTWIEDQPGHDAANSAVVLKDIIDVEPASVSVASSRQETGHIYPVCKRAFDVFFSTCALVILLPFMALITLLLLREDGRPIFYGHVRQGRGGRLFKCWKFRTMFRDAEQRAREFGENLCDGPQINIPNDPRVTRVGRFLRNNNLDELPQFWNVLIGEMSLVGPRPSPDDENQFCPAWRDLRLSVRPGITGLWQLKRTREPGEDFQEWIRYDTEYVQRATFWFDLAILVRTAHMLLMRRARVGSE